jgi:hypothetical protein
MTQTQMTTLRQGDYLRETNSRSTPVTKARVAALNSFFIVFATFCAVLVVRMLVKWNTLKRRNYPVTTTWDQKANTEESKRKRSSFPSQWCRHNALLITRRALSGCRQCTKDIWVDSCADPDDPYCRNKVLREFRQRYQHSPPSYFEVLRNYLSTTRRTFTTSEGGYTY